MNEHIKCKKYEEFLSELRDSLEQRLYWYNINTSFEELKSLLQKIKNLLEP